MSVVVMNSFGSMEIGLIVAIVVVVICLILFLDALKSKKKAQQTIEEQYKTREQKLNDEHDEELEKERIENKKQVTKQKEDYEATVNAKEQEIDALKLFSKNKSRSEEHTSELQSRFDLVCRLLLEKKKTSNYNRL